MTGKKIKIKAISQNFGITLFSHGTESMVPEVFLEGTFLTSGSLSLDPLLGQSNNHFFFLGIG